MESEFLRDKRVLVVEDEYFLAEELCRDLQHSGAVVVGPVPSVKQALRLIADEPALDAAVLDFNLGGELARPVADALLANSVPVVITTGYDDSTLDQYYPRIARCRKPVESRVVTQALATAMAERSRGDARE